MNRTEFIKYIESIGFEYHGFYRFEKIYIDIHFSSYSLFADEKRMLYNLDDLEPIKRLKRCSNLKKLLR